MSRGLLAVLVACAFCAHALAQEPPAPARVGTPGVVQPRLIRQVNPAYPEIARGARVSGIVILQATIDTSGRVSKVLVMRSNPLLDDAALSAVRQWEFAPPLVNGRATPVVTTVNVYFKLESAIAPPPPATAAVSPSGMPPDFAVFYSEGCGLGSIALTSGSHEMGGIYRALLDARLLSGAELLRWPNPPPASVAAFTDGIEVLVPATTPAICAGHGPPVQFGLAVRSSGIWAQLWPPPARPEFQTRRHEQQVSAIRKLVLKAIARK